MKQRSPDAYYIYIYIYIYYICNQKDHMVIYYMHIKDPVVHINYQSLVDYGNTKITQHALKQ